MWRLFRSIRRQTAGGRETTFFAICPPRTTRRRIAARKMRLLLGLAAFIFRDFHLPLWCDVFPPSLLYYWERYWKRDCQGRRVEGERGNCYWAGYWRQLKEWHKIEQVGVGENGNLSTGAEYNSSSSSSESELGWGDHFFIQEDPRIECMVPHAHPECALFRFCYQWWDPFSYWMIPLLTPFVSVVFPFLVISALLIPGRLITGLSKLGSWAIWTLEME